MISVSISFSPFSLVRATRHYIRFELHVYRSELPLFILNRAVDIPLYIPPKFVSLISYPRVPSSCKLRHDIFSKCLSTG